MSKKKLETLGGSVLNFMQRDVVIIDGGGRRLAIFPHCAIDRAPVMLCNKECPRYGTGRCPRPFDVTDPACVGVMEKDATMSVKRIVTLRQNIPIYQWNSKKPEYVRNLKKCVTNGWAAATDLPDVKKMIQNFERVGSQMIVRGAEMTKDLQRDLDELSKPVYVIVPYSIALMMEHTGDDMDYVLVPVKPVYGAGKLIGYSGLMQAKYLTEG